MPHVPLRACLVPSGFIVAGVMLAAAQSPAAPAPAVLRVHAAGSLRAAAGHAGASKALAAKSLQLTGGPNSPPPRIGAPPPAA